LDLTGRMCPMIMCVNPDCPLNKRETPPPVNGCPSCPRCRDTEKCECGKPCKTHLDVSGTCQVNGVCSLNKMVPKCQNDNKCGECGSKCKTKANKAGICQANGQCKGGKKAAVCDKHCPPLKCVEMLVCPLSQQETAKDSDNCPLCPHCKIVCPMYKCVAPLCPTEEQETSLVNGCRTCPRCKTLCTADKDCTVENTFCNVASKQCLPFLKTGDHCPSMAVANHNDYTKRCAKGSVCSTDTSVCTVCVPLPCPHPMCDATEMVDTLQNNGCPGCPRCRAVIG